MRVVYMASANTVGRACPAGLHQGLPCMRTLHPAQVVLALPAYPQVVASGVIKQNGGINMGKNGSLMKFDTGVQFTINDPAVMQVRCPNILEASTHLR
jgi:hypothetical protein